MPTNSIETTIRRIKGMTQAHTIGSWVRWRRLESGLTQDELAQKSELSRCYINRLEKGREIPRLETALRIALHITHRVNRDEILRLIASATPKVAPASDAQRLMDAFISHDIDSCLKIIRKIA